VMSVFVVQVSLPSQLERDSSDVGGGGGVPLTVQLIGSPPMHPALHRIVSTRGGANLNTPPPPSTAGQRSECTYIYID